MNGCALLEKMDMKGLHLPVIVITAFDEPKYRECCKEYGVIAYLRKPVDSEALIDIIKYNLENQSPIIKSYHHKQKGVMYESSTHSNLCFISWEVFVLAQDADQKLV